MNIWFHNYQFLDKIRKQLSTKQDIVYENNLVLLI